MEENLRGVEQGVYTDTVSCGGDGGNTLGYKSFRLTFFRIHLFRHVLVVLHI
jgi:hypothetical protein